MSFKEIVAGLTELDIHIKKDGFQNFLSLWLIRDEPRGQTVLVESGPASAVPELCDNLKALGAERIDYLIYTHIHLDHSGGAGQFHERHPNTKILVPLGGQAHLITPGRLYEASVSTLGASLVNSYGEPIPLPGDAFIKDAPKGLTVINTPGHAPFHDSYLYDLGGTRILFPGEAAGFFCRLPGHGVYQRPATPHKFYYDIAIESLDRLLAAGPADIICYPHYGCAKGEDAKSAIQNAKQQLRLWKDVISTFNADSAADEVFAALRDADGLLSGVSALPENEAEREMYFIRQSIAGFMGHIFK